MWILLYRFHRIFNCRKTWLDYINLFSPNDYKNNYKINYLYICIYIYIYIYISTLNTHMAKENLSFDFRQKNRWIKKLFSRKKEKNSNLMHEMSEWKLLWEFLFYFCCYCLLVSLVYYEFCIRIKNLCSNCKN